MPAIARLRILIALASGVLATGAANADKLLFSMSSEYAIQFSHNGVLKEVKAQGHGVATVNRSTTGPMLNTLELTRPFAKINAIATVGTRTPGGVAEIHFDGVRINPLLAGPSMHPGVFAPIFGAMKGAPPALTKRTLPAAGTIRLCNFTGCPASVKVKLTQTSRGFAIGPGVGGTFRATGMSGTMTPQPPTKLTVMGHPWTVNATTVSYRTRSGAVGTFKQKGFAHGPLGMTGTTLNTVMGTKGSVMGGSVQLVTGTRTTCLGCTGGNNPSGQITRLTLNFAPEPGLLVLLGAGSIGLALLGRKRIP